MVWVGGYDYQNKDKNITIMKTWSLLCFSVQGIIAKTMWFPILLLLPSWTSSWIFFNAEKPTTTCQSNSPNKTAAENYQNIIINCSWFQVEICFKMVAILDTILDISTFWIKPSSILIVSKHPKKVKTKVLLIKYMGHLGLRSLDARVASVGFINYNA